MFLFDTSHRVVSSRPSSLAVVFLAPLLCGTLAPGLGFSGLGWCGFRHQTLKEGCYRGERLRGVG